MGVLTFGRNTLPARLVTNPGDTEILQLDIFEIGTFLKDYRILQATLRMNEKYKINIIPDIQYLELSKATRLYIAFI